MKVLDSEAEIANYVDPEFIPEYIAGGKSKYTIRDWLFQFDCNGAPLVPILSSSSPFSSFSSSS